MGTRRRSGSTLAAVPFRRDVALLAGRGGEQTGKRLNRCWACVGALFGFSWQRSDEEGAGQSRQRTSGSTVLRAVVPSRLLGWALCNFCRKISARASCGRLKIAIARWLHGSLHRNSEVLL